MKHLFRWLKARLGYRVLYPELLKAGGLNNALNREFKNINSILTVASDKDLHKLPFVYARVENENKFCQIYIAAEKKSFSSDFWRDGVCLAHASTARLAELAMVIDNWLTQDQTTHALADQFSIVRPNEKAKAFDDNAEVEYTWSLLLSDDSMGLLEFVAIASKDEQLNKLFPFTSLYTLCFSRCTGYPYDTENMPNVTAKQFGQFLPYSHRGESGDNNPSPERLYIVTKKGKEYLGEGNAREALRIVKASLPKDIQPARKGVAE